MARGKAVNIQEYLTNIEPFLKEGCSLNEACLHGHIPYTTVKDYYDKDETVRNKIECWRNEPILKALESVNRGILTNPDLALKYLERKKKDEFSLRQEVTGKDGEAIGPIVYMPKEDK